MPPPTREEFIARFPRAAKAFEPKDEAKTVAPGHTIQVRISPTLYRALQREAKRHRGTVAGLVRHILLDHYQP
jgi:hypothetical protein